MKFFVLKYWPWLLALIGLLLIGHGCYRWGAGDKQVEWDKADATRTEQVRAEQKRTDTVTTKSAVQVAASDAAAGRLRHVLFLP